MSLIIEVSKIKGCCNKCGGNIALGDEELAAGSDSTYIYRFTCPICNTENYAESNNFIFKIKGIENEKK